MKFSYLSDMVYLMKEKDPLAEATAKRSAASDFKGAESVINDALNDLSEKVDAIVDIAKDTGAIKLDTVKDKDGQTVFKKMAKITETYKAAMEKLLIEAESMVMQVSEGAQVDGHLLDEAMKSYVICLMDGNKLEGYYASDSDPVNESVKRARSYAILEDATATTKRINKLMELYPGQKFVVIDKDELREALSEGKVYGDSADFTEEFYAIGQKINDIKSVVKSPRWMGWMKITDHNFDTSCEDAGHDVVEATDQLANAWSQLESEFDKASGHPPATVAEPVPEPAPEPVAPEPVAPEEGEDLGATA